MMGVLPQSLDHYRLLRLLGCGGMAEIYLAWDEREQRKVALKVVDMAQEDHVWRFRREAETLHLLKHEHILPIFHCGEQDGRAYFAMPYLPLGSLRDRLCRGPPTVEEAGSIFMQVADALHYAHERGVLHRDIKPSNILFRDERSIYLADFGLAKLVEREGSITQTGCLVGTPHYLAPELATEEARQSSDQYALGVLLYKMLTGTVPFRGRTAISICWKHVHQQPLPPSSLNPTIPPAIDRLILQALAKDPADRFPSVRHMALAYRQALREIQQAPTTGALSNFFAWSLPRMRIQTHTARLFIKAISTQAPQSRPFTPNDLFRLFAAGAIIMAFCITPFYLGFALGQERMEPVQDHVQRTSLEARPFLAGKASRAETQSGSLLLFPDPALSVPATASSHAWLFTIQQQPGNGQSMADRQAGITQNSGQKDMGKNHGQKKHHAHQKAGKSAGGRGKHRKRTL